MARLLSVPKMYAAGFGGFSLGHEKSVKRPTLKQRLMAQTLEGPRRRQPDDDDAIVALVCAGLLLVGLAFVGV